jgi:hypothetical protein
MLSKGTSGTILARSSKYYTLMPPGPILIFDKSALQALSVDESNWLDNFFMTNITPLFFAETLADLEKEIRDGRTPEQVVGNLALKTPDMSSTACAHHWKIISGVLAGREMPMDVRIPRDFGKVVYFTERPESSTKRARKKKRWSVGIGANSWMSSGRSRNSGGLVFQWSITVSFTPSFRIGSTSGNPRTKRK